MNDVQRWAIPAGYVHYRTTLNSEDVEHVVLASAYDATVARLTERVRELECLLYAMEQGAQAYADSFVSPHAKMLDIQPLLLACECARAALAKREG